MKKNKKKHQQEETTNTECCNKCECEGIPTKSKAKGKTKTKTTTTTKTTTKTKPTTNNAEKKMVGRYIKETGVCYRSLNRTVRGMKNAKNGDTTTDTLALTIRELTHKASTWLLVGGTCYLDVVKAPLKKYQKLSKAYHTYRALMCDYTHGIQQLSDTSYNLIKNKTHVLSTTLDDDTADVIKSYYKHVTTTMAAIKAEIKKLKSGRMGKDERLTAMRNILNNVTRITPPSPSFLPFCLYYKKACSHCVWGKVYGKCITDKNSLLRRLKKVLDKGFMKAFAVSDSSTTTKTIDKKR